jgi:hypothetical protein
MNVLAVVNTLTAEKAVRNLEGMNEARRRELHVSSTEPAIARVFAEDERGKRKTYFYLACDCVYRELRPFDCVTDRLTSAAMTALLWLFRRLMSTAIWCTVS